MPAYAGVSAARRCRLGCRVGSCAWRAHRGFGPCTVRLMGATVIVNVETAIDGGLYMRGSGEEGPAEYCLTGGAGSAQRSCSACRLSLLLAVPGIGDAHVGAKEKDEAAQVGPAHDRDHGCHRTIDQVRYGDVCGNKE